MPKKPVDAAIAIVVGPCIDDTDFKSREQSIAFDAAGLVIDVILERADGIVTMTTVTPTGSTAGTYNWDHLGQGYYQLDLPASGGASFNNDTEGILRVVGYATGVLPFSSVAYDIVPQTVYNSEVVGTDKLEVDVVQWRGSTPAVLTDTDKVNAYVGNKGVLNDLAAGAAMTLTAAYDSAKTAAQAAVCTETRLAELDAANLPTDVANVKTQTNSIETDTQDLQNQIGTDGAGLTAIGDARLANLDATVSSRLASTSYTAPDNAGIANVLAAVDTEVASVLAAVDTEVAAIKAKTDLIPAAPAAVSDIPSAATIADAVWDESTGAHQQTGSTGLALSTATAPTAEAVADAVWEEPIGDHSGVSGSTAEALNAAGAAGDPWTTLLPGAYGDGSAGKIVGDNINATVASRSSHSAADVKTAVEIAGGSIALIKAKTDNLPVSPAATGAAMTLTAAYDAAKTAAQAAVCTETRLAELDAANLPTDVANVKTQTNAIETDTQDLQTQIGVDGAGLTAIGDTRIANLDATVSSRLASSGYTAPDNAGIANVLAAVDTEVASVLAAVDTEVAAIKAKTDLIPASPAAVGSAMTLANDAITAAAFDESTAFPLKSADTGATQIARTGADADTLKTLSDEIAAVKGDTTAVLADTGTDGVVVATASKTGYTLAVTPPTAADIKIAIEADGSKIDHLWETTEDDGGVRRFTANALEEAPGGGTGGDASAANQALILEDLADIKGTSFVKDTNSLVNVTGSAPVTLQIESEVTV